MSAWTLADHEQAARDYRAALTITHFAEASWHGEQRMANLMAFARLARRLPRWHAFNELHVQFFLGGALRQFGHSSLTRHRW